MNLTVDPPQLPDRLPYEDNGNPKYLDISELAKGDVLLSSSELKGKGSWITWLVRVLDDAGYSHMAFFDGSNAIEAGLSDGVVRTEIAAAVKRNRYTDVYSFKSDDGKVIGSPPNWAYEPLGVTANNYCGHGYGRSDAILAGILVQMRKSLFSSGDALDVLLFAMQVAIKTLQNILSRTSPDKAVTCSELVYRIFYEALPKKKYRITIDPTRDINDDLRTLKLTDSPEKVFDIEIPVSLALTPDFDSNSEVEHYLKNASEQEAEVLHKINEFSLLYSQVKNRESLHLSGEDFAQGILPPNRNKLDQVADYVTPGDICASNNVLPRGRIKK